MRNLLSIAIIIIGFSSNAQEVMTDWKQLDGKTTLKEYIQDQAYDYLKFKPTQENIVQESGGIIPDSSVTTNIIIRCQSSVPDIPLVVINNYPTDNTEVWDLIELQYVTTITAQKPTDRTFVQYGLQGKNGLIFVEMNKRQWTKIKRKMR